MIEKKYLPCLLDVTEAEILILGAGKASAEKLRTLEKLGKTVTVISPEFSEEFLDKDWLNLVPRKYNYGDLSGFGVVYCGINDPETEQEILKEAIEKKILINFVDLPKNSSFISVASLIKPNYTIFISTYGKSPGGAKMIREKIESGFDLDALDIEVGVMIKNRRKNNYEPHS